MRKNVHFAFNVTIKGRESHRFQANSLNFLFPDFSNEKGISEFFSTSRKSDDFNVPFAYNLPL